MLLMRAWGSRAGPADAHDARPLGASVATQKTTKKKPFTGGTRGSAALASGLILLRRRPEASKAIPGTTRAKRSAFARSFGDLALPDLMATASAADPLQGGPRHCGLRPRIMYIYIYIYIVFRVDKTMVDKWPRTQWDTNSMCDYHQRQCVRRM